MAQKGGRKASNPDRDTMAHDVPTVRGVFVPSRVVMSERTHFWLRLAGLAVILAAEFGPKLWSLMPSAGAGTGSPMASVTTSR
jgi:hypothetical protein